MSPPSGDDGVRFTRRRPTASVAQSGCLLAQLTVVYPATKTAKLGFISMGSGSYAVATTLPSTSALSIHHSYEQRSSSSGNGHMTTWLRRS